MNYLPEFITVASINILAVMSPGLAFVMIVRNNIVYSRKTAIISAIGLGLGVGLHILLCLLGIGLIVSRSLLLFTILKYIGAIYLLYIGYQSISTKSQSSVKVAREKGAYMTNLQALQIGFLTNATNPRATLFFLSIFTQVISPSTPIFIQIIYGVEMMMAESLWFIFISFVFSHSVIKNRLYKVQILSEKIAGVVLIGLGIKLFLSSIK